MHSATLSRIAIYARLSKDKTGAGLAIERQVSELLAHFALPPATRVYADNDISATSGKLRPAYQQMLAEIQAGRLERIYVWHTDRLWRLPRELEDLIDAADRFNVSTYAKQAGMMDLSTPAGRVAARIGVSIAKYEVEIKSERQRARNLQAAQKGLPHVTHRPYGYEADGITLRPAEVEGLRQMLRLTLDGWSYLAVAERLNLAGYRTTRGRPWIALTIRRSLFNKRYAGIREYQGIETPAVWPAVFSDDEWARLRLELRRRHEAASGNKQAVRYLLSNIARCSLCGHGLSGTATRSHRDTTERQVYRCNRSQGGCGKVSRNAEPLEEFVRQMVVFRLDTPDLGVMSRDVVPG